jgi:hypothetical protein
MKSVTINIYGSEAVIGAKVNRINYLTIDDGRGIIIQLRQWVGLWKSNTSPDIIQSLAVPSQTLLDASIERVVRTLDEAGFSLRYVTNTRRADKSGDAYRGPVTRVDLIKAGDTWRIGQYMYGWLPGSKAHKTEVRQVSETDIDDLTAKLIERGFTRTNSITAGGTMQCWQNVILEGAEKPLHTKKDILYMRDHYRPVQANLAFEFQGALPERSRTNVHPAAFAAQEI